ncbi:hypothetical protein V8C37DRAFT_368789 [Trichoderma ceciliae]
MKAGCIHLVSSRRPHVPRQPDVIPNREPDTGICVNLADMQRMCMRQLQIRLIDIAAAQQLPGTDKDGMPLRELAELGVR